ncbi:MAG: MFS transporter [Gammaproteobacteria bacterium]|nr:MFS transporter [Gammaproteobacteria bacterium]MDE0270373.1 MFS transporter [Gammaproteobacteria bacterium]
MDLEENRVESRHYAFLMFLTLLNVMNFVDRQLLGSFANFIVPDLGLTNTEFGLLTGLFFIVFYSAMGLFMGALADMVNRTRLIAAGLALWSALTALSGAARGFWTLAAPRMLIGVGESIMTPTAMSLLSDRFPASKLGFASGFYYMGVPIGVGASLLIAGYLGPAIGWRNCFYVLGGIGLALAGAMLFIKETPRRHLAVAAETAVAQRPTFRQILKTLGFALRNCPALTLTIAGGITTHFILGAATFDQLWYVQERGFERAQIAQWTGWVGLVGGVLGNLFGGLGSDRFLARTGLGRPMFLFWITIVFAPFGIAYRLVDGDSIWFWIGVFVGFFQLGCFYGPTFSTVQELVPPNIRATVVAFYILVLNFIGLGVGITLGGVIIDLLMGLGVAAPYTWTLLAFTIISLGAAPLYYWAGRRYQSDRQRLLEMAA